MLNETPYSNETSDGTQHSVSVGVTYTGRKIFRETLDLAGAKALLSPLNLHDVLEFCARLNAVNQITPPEVEGWKSAGGKELIECLLHYLPEAVHRQRARDISRTPMPFSPLVGAAISGIIGLACRWCQEEGGEPLANSLCRGNVMRVLFALQGALVDKKKLMQIGNVGGLRQAFPYVTRSILANRPVNMTHDLGRLHALASRPEIHDALAKRGKCSVNDWFQGSFGLSVSRYQYAMTALTCYAAQFRAKAPSSSPFWLPLRTFVEAVGGSHAEVEALIRSAETTPELLAKKSEPVELAEAVYYIDDLLVTPLLRVGDAHLITSFEGVFANFMHGLSYKSSRVAEQRSGGPDKDIAAGARGGFGPIFEEYACWLAFQWFGDSNVEVITNYRVKLPGHKSFGELPQGDILFIYGGVGYLIEVKAIVPPLPVRRCGDLSLIVKMLVPSDKNGTLDRSGLVLQTRRLGEGLVNGCGVRADGKTPIPALRRVFPIGLVFEHLPLRYPFTIPFEMDVQQTCGVKVFEDSGALAPLQFFDIEAFEMWDAVFDLPLEAAGLLAALEKRATNEIFRYETIEHVRGCRRTNRRQKPGVLQILADESEGFVRANCKPGRAANTGPERAGS